MNNLDIENVAHFSYLGSVISHSEPGTSEKVLGRPIGMARGKFAEMNKVLCNYRLNLNIRMNL